MKITGNGLFPVNLRSSSSSMFYVSGVLGGATVNIVKKAGFNLTTDPLVVDTMYEAKHGSEVNLYIEVSGASGTTNIVIDVHGLS
jgi:hypothetical protein